MNTLENTINQFRQAMMAHGLNPPDIILDDGAIHRFSSENRSRKSSWYIFHSDGVPAGVFGDWKAGFTQTWCAKSDKAMTPTELDHHRQRVKAMKAQRDADEFARLKSEADKARERWHSATDAHGHAYLVRKGVQPHGIRQDGQTLLIPLRDTTGKLHSLQTIMPDGEKRFKGRMKGCYHAIGGKPAGRIVICEGYATGASIHEATGDAVAVAFNAGNLGPVAVALHKAYPALMLVIAADDDWCTEGNTGLSAARQAALAVGGLVVMPQFPTGRPPKATDFNDLATLAGLAAVRACFTEIEEAAC